MSKLNYQTLLKIVREDRRPALGVTEPAAIALACAAARSLSEESPQSILLRENSGMYKNAYTCGIPGSAEVGNLHAAALGAVAGDHRKGLLVLEDIAEDAAEKARQLVEAGAVGAEISGYGSDIFIAACIRTEHDVCEAEIRGDHTNLCLLKKNGRVVWQKEAEVGRYEESKPSPIVDFTLADFVDAATHADDDALAFLAESFAVNLNLAQSALADPRCTLCKSLYQANGGRFISDDLRASVRAVTCAAAEGRVLGLAEPAMSITGSGNHGIIASLPLYALQQVEGLAETRLYRGLLLSSLVTIYMKEFSGKLSAFCGCGVAAGSGAACGLTFMRGGGYQDIERTLNNMAASLVGMICTGGNHACCMKVLSAVDTALTASQLALDGCGVSPLHGICGATPEQTMRNIGRVAFPGMSETEKIVLDIMEKK